MAAKRLRARLQMTEDLFIPEERRILEVYRHPTSSNLRRATRLSIQYVLGAGIFTYLAIAYNSWFALVTYLTFVAFVGLRLIGAWRIVGVMPNVLAKYAARIAELEARVAELEAGALSYHDSEDVAGGHVAILVLSSLLCAERTWARSRTLRE